MTLSRRSLAQGAAWAVPAVTVAAAVPAMAASSGPCAAVCPTNADINFGGKTDGNGWQQHLIGSVTTKSTQAYQSSWAPVTAINASCTDQASGTTTTVPALSHVFLFSKNPTSAGTKLYYGKSLCLTAGTTYTFSFKWNAYALNNYGIYGQVQIATTLGGAPVIPTAVSTQLFIDGCSTPSTGTNKGTGCKTANLTGTGSVSFKPTSTGTYYLQYAWWFEPGSSYTEDDCGDQFNDIAFQEPTVTCA